MMDVSSERAQVIREYFANQYDRANRRKPNPLIAGRDGQGDSPKPGFVIAMWAGEVVEFAQGWPADLNTALRAVATHAQPNGWRLDPDGFNSAMTAAHENRRTYYEDRLDRCERLDPRHFSR